MAYRLKVTAAADGDPDALPRKTFERVDEHILSLAETSRPPGILKLQGKSDYWRLRVGEYRILYEIHDRERLVVIARVLHRRKGVSRGLKRGLRGTALADQALETADSEPVLGFSPWPLIPGRRAGWAAPPPRFVDRSFLQLEAEGSRGGDLPPRRPRRPHGRGRRHRNPPFKRVGFYIAARRGYAWALRTDVVYSGRLIVT